MTDVAARRARLVERSVSGRFSGFVNLGAALAVIGLGLFVFALLGKDAERAWHMFHVNWVFFTGIAGGSIALAAVHKIANAKWSGVILRFSEAAVAFLPISFVAFLLIFTVGYSSIYGHMTEQLGSLSAGKAIWLSHWVMFARLGLGLVILFFVGWALIRADMIPDMFLARNAVTGARKDRFDRFIAGFDGSDTGRVQHNAKIHRLAPVYIVTYALVFTLIAFDGMMALQPHWFSNLFGGWYFMGSFLAAHTLLALLSIYGARQLGIGDLVTAKQRHDIGKLAFGFTVFWAYLMWSQFLVIWYGNLPEETGFVFSRLWGPWFPLGRAVFLGMFIIPFWGLIFVASKMNRWSLALFSTISLCALFLERYLLIMPSVTAESGPVVGIAEVGPTLGFLGLFLLSYGLFGRTFPMLSPRLAEITLDRESGH